jgi:phage virion morphogenesis protein
MAGIITFDTELRDGAARLALQDMLDQMDNKRPFYASVGERLLSSTKDRFRQQNAPDGTPWAPLSPRTIKARESAGLTPISILRARGYLAGSINYIATSDEVSVGSGVAYAAIHQLGGTINKPSRQAKIYRMKDDNGQVGRRFVKKGDANHVTDVTIPAHKINIPARPYLGLTTADEEGILEDAQDWLMG